MITFSVSLHRQRGASLIITLIMLVVIGLTAASAMKTATSSEKVVNNIRMQSGAQQYAEAALRYCESQLKLVSSSRVATLQDASVPVTTTATSNWEKTSTWVGGATLKTVVPAAALQSANSAYVPAVKPECYAESQLITGVTFTVITSRGFSPDYTTTLASGATTNGSVAWMQSLVTLK